MVEKLGEDDDLSPACAGRFSREPIPENRVPDAESPGDAVYRFHTGFSHT